MEPGLLGSCSGLARQRMPGTACMIDKCMPCIGGMFVAWVLGNALVSTCCRTSCDQSLTLGRTRHQCCGGAWQGEVVR